jgi:hypothetical protein
MTAIRNMFHRLRLNWKWIAAQFLLTLLLILIALAWTRLPDKHIWQVAMTLLIPLLLAISALELQAGTVRAFADDDGHRVKLIWGAVTLLVWIAIGFASWALLDWCDDQIPLWSGYLNSKMTPHARATTFSYEHLQRYMTIAEWVLRWIVVPAKLIPFAAASTQSGWRLPWRRLLRFLWSWRWWLGVVLASLIGVWLPSSFFDKAPAGSVSAQVWTVSLKLAGAYVLVVGVWVLLLAWWASLFRLPAKPPTEEALIAVPVLAGPPDRDLKARAEIPPPENTPS